MKIIDGFIFNEEIFFISPFVKHQKFTDFFTNCSMLTIKHYMYSLLESISVLEKNGVVHKDIKPDNFLFDLESNKGVLIDFGISYCELPQEKITKYPQLYQVLTGLNNYSKQRIGTRGFLAPEIIFNAKKQTSKVDIWSAGIILLSFFSAKIPILNLNSFVKIQDETIRDLIPLLIVFGEEKLSEIAEMHDIKMYIPPIMKETFLDKGLEKLIKRKDVDSSGIELLKILLELDCRKRCTSIEALNHSFFDEIREIKKELNSSLIENKMEVDEEAIDSYKEINSIKKVSKKTSIENKSISNNTRITRSSKKGNSN